MAVICVLWLSSSMSLAYIACVGEVIHDRKYRDQKQLEGKKVVIIGYGKSSLDIACQAGVKAKSCTVIARDLRWLLPVALGGIFQQLAFWCQRRDLPFILQAYTCDLYCSIVLLV